MKKLTLKALVLAGLTIVASLNMASANSFNHSGQASTHSAAASGHASVGVSQTASIAVAVPLLAVGAVGALSSEAGGVLMEAACCDEPLEVSDDTFVEDVNPAQAIQNNH